jgi:hypothetical protein
MDIAYDYPGEHHTLSRKRSNIPKLEALNRRTDNRMVKRKRTNNDLENTTLNRE